MVGEDVVESYIERSQSLIEESPQMGEQNTKVKIVQPLIDLLGWDVYSGEVELEYPMQIGRGNTQADYALQLEGVPVVFIEAKGCDSTLSESDISQLASYMRQKGVDWGLLTNGNQFEVLKRRTDSSRPEEVTLAEFPLEDLDENWSVVRLLAKDLVETGEANTIARRIEARKRAVRTLKQDKESVSEDVAQRIISEVGDELAQEIKTEAKKFVDELIESLSTDREADVQLSGERPQQPKKSAVELGFRVTLHENGEQVRTFSDASQSDAMAQAVDFLIQERGLVDQLDSFPYVPGEKSAILNSEPKHPTGEEMRLFRELSDDYFLYVSLNKESKQRYIKQFAEKCSLEADFSGEW